MAIPNIKNESEFEKVVNMAMKQVLDDTTINDISIREWIDKITSGEYKLVKHGRWERRMTNIYACSECTNEVANQQRKNYSLCPYCGAQMDGD